APRVVTAAIPVDHLEPLARDLDPAVPSPDPVIPLGVGRDPTVDNLDVALPPRLEEGHDLGCVGEIESDITAWIATTAQRAERLDDLVADRADLSTQIWPQRTRGTNVVLTGPPHDTRERVDHVHVLVQAHPHHHGRLAIRAEAVEEHP